MKNVIFGAGALLMLTACAGFNFPTIPAPPTEWEVSDASEAANAELERVCLALDKNEKNLQGWLDFAAMIGAALDFDIAGKVEIPAQVVNAKDSVCE